MIKKNRNYGKITGALQKIKNDLDKYVEETIGHENKLHAKKTEIDNEIATIRDEQSKSKNTSSKIGELLGVE